MMATVFMSHEESFGFFVYLFSWLYTHSKERIFGVLIEYGLGLASYLGGYNTYGTCFQTRKVFSLCSSVSLELLS